MTLQPMKTEGSVQYPHRRASLVLSAGRWIRRVGAIATASAAFWSAGCFLIGTGGEPAAPDYFYLCEEGWTGDYGELSIPGTFTGCLEPNQEATATLNVQSTVRLRISFDETTFLAPGEISADFIDPEDNVAAVIGSGEPVEVELAPGIWTIAVNSSNPDEGGFGLVIELAD